MKLALVVAKSNNNIIGKDNDLPWVLPSDLKRFRSVTLGKVVIMGRKTFESIGKPLPERNNIVLTKSQKFADRFVYGQPTLLTVTDTLPAIQLASRIAHSNTRLTKDPSKDEVVVIGGESLYREFLPMAHRIYLTTIHIDCEGDTTFPQLNRDEWSVSTSETISDDKSWLKSDTTKTPLSYTFEVLERKINS